MRKKDQNIFCETLASLFAIETECLTAQNPFPNELINEKRKSCSLERKHMKENVKERNCSCGHAYYMVVRIANEFAALLYRINSTWVYKGRCNYHCSWQPQLMRQTARYVARVHLGATLQNSTLRGKIFSLHLLEFILRRTRNV